MKLFFVPMTVADFWAIELGVETVRIAVVVVIAFVGMVFKVCRMGVANRRAALVEGTSVKAEVVFVESLSVVELEDTGNGD